LKEIKETFPNPQRVRIEVNTRYITTFSPKKNKECEQFELEPSKSKNSHRLNG